MELSHKLDETTTELLSTKVLLMEKDEEVKQGQLQLSQISEELVLNSASRVSIRLYSFSCTKKTIL